MQEGVGKNRAYLAHSEKMMRSLHSSWRKSAALILQLWWWSKVPLLQLTTPLQSRAYPLHIEERKAKAYLSCEQRQ
jgi:hypothetical protein